MARRAFFQVRRSGTASNRRSLLDIIALMDALKIEKAIIAGFDWGARTADIMAALWPERCKALVSVSGYLIGSQASQQEAVAAKGGAAMVVPISISPPNAAGPATRNTGTTLRSSSGSSRRRSGTSMTPRSIARRRRSTTRIMSRS